jgi:leucine carboxyl methyltransferase
VQIPLELVFAPVDFERQELGAQLQAAGFSRAAPAVFSWVAVSQYLARDAVEATLEVRLMADLLISRGASGGALCPALFRSTAGALLSAFDKATQLHGVATTDQEATR